MSIDDDEIEKLKLQLDAARKDARQTVAWLEETQRRSRLGIVTKDGHLAFAAAAVVVQRKQQIETALEAALEAVGKQGPFRRLKRFKK